MKNRPGSRPPGRCKHAPMTPAYQAGWLMGTM